MLDTVNQRFEWCGEGLLRNESYVASLNMLVYYQIFEAQGANIYKIAADFGKVLAKANCRVPVACLPFDGIFRCIEFPDGLSFPMGANCYGSCVYTAAFSIDPVKGPIKGFLGHDGQNYEKRLDFIVPLHSAESFKEEFRDSITLFVNNEDDFGAAVEKSIKLIGENKTGFRTDIINYTLKCLLYIHSGDPDLREFRPEPKPSNAKKIKRWRREQLCQVPVTLVGFSYLKERERHVESTWVEPHWRTYHYGTGKTQQKVLFVHQHLRRFL
jgi:hypothetical protein